ncbi:MAG: hypothetical protein PWQ06_200 [Anaerophaga sp.]|jgi:hypothetical protein|nr:hypothetical protein [Anaerophaga sp.]
MGRTTYATLFLVYGKFPLVPKIDVNPVTCLSCFEIANKIYRFRFDNLILKNVFLTFNPCT